MSSKIFLPPGPELYALSHPPPQLLGRCWKRQHRLTLRSSPAEGTFPGGRWGMGRVRTYTSEPNINRKKQEMQCDIIQLWRYVPTMIDTRIHQLYVLKIWYSDSPSVNQWIRCYGLKFLHAWCPSWGNGHPAMFVAMQVKLQSGRHPLPASYALGSHVQ